MWEQFFLDFFDYSAEAIGIVVSASGCREGWLQGELYRAGRRRGCASTSTPSAAIGRPTCAAGSRPGWWRRSRCWGRLSGQDAVRP